MSRTLHDLVVLRQDLDNPTLMARVVNVSSTTLKIGYNVCVGRYGTEAKTFLPVGIFSGMTSNSTLLRYRLASVMGPVAITSIPPGATGVIVQGGRTRKLLVNPVATINPGDFLMLSTNVAGAAVKTTITGNGAIFAIAGETQGIAGGTHNIIAFVLPWGI